MARPAWASTSSRPGLWPGDSLRIGLCGALLLVRRAGRKAPQNAVAGHLPRLVRQEAALDEGEFTPQERAAMIAYRLGQGHTMTTKEIADYCQMTYQGAM